ncbi:PilZ domain-containing protein [Sphingomonas sp.]|uniref:PilZ domain-containing protein n=1 Tax=Sphingomonas sp. TaxID=28214 RepID=UPI001ED36CCA|nr:PilZ domain-containing protein [Sphingomonas sp.]MBX3595867.1 PilZ domain-containing protein [Sphingomonas sp.]
MLAAELTVGSRREQARARLNAPGRIEAAGGGRCVCQISDLSIAGARLLLHHRVEPESRITLTLPGGLTITGRIVWATEFEAGCAFTQPIGKKVFRQLIDRHGLPPPPSSVPGAPRDARRTVSS